MSSLRHDDASVKHDYLDGPYLDLWQPVERPSFKDYFAFWADRSIEVSAGDCLLRHFRGACRDRDRVCVGADVSMIPCTLHGPSAWCYVQRDGSHVDSERCVCGRRTSVNCPVDAHRFEAQERQARAWAEVER
jgi:hypothetical protein